MQKDSTQSGLPNSRGFDRILKRKPAILWKKQVEAHSEKNLKTPWKFRIFKNMLFWRRRWTIWPHIQITRVTWMEPREKKLWLGCDCSFEEMYMNGKWNRRKCAIKLKSFNYHEGDWQVLRTGVTLEIEEYFLLAGVKGVKWGCTAWFDSPFDSNAQEAIHPFASSMWYPLVDDSFPLLRIQGSLIKSGSHSKPYCSVLD